MKNGLVEYVDGAKCWYKDDLLHNENGPAFERTDGTKHWYLNGKLHREDGPAIEYFGGDKDWYLDGVEVTEKEVMNRWNAMQEKKLLEDSTESNNKLTKRLKL